MNKRLTSKTVEDPYGDGFFQCPKCLEDSCILASHRLYYDGKYYDAVHIEYCVSTNCNHIKIKKNK